MRCQERNGNPITMRLASSSFVYQRWRQWARGFRRGIFMRHREEQCRQNSRCILKRRALRQHGLLLRALDIKSRTGRAKFIREILNIPRRGKRCRPGPAVRAPLIALVYRAGRRVIIAAENYERRPVVCHCRGSPGPDLGFDPKAVPCGSARRFCVSEIRIKK